MGLSLRYLCRVVVSGGDPGNLVMQGGPDPKIQSCLCGLCFNFTKHCYCWQLHDLEMSAEFPMPEPHALHPLLQESGWWDQLDVGWNIPTGSSWDFVEAKMWSVVSEWTFMMKPPSKIVRSEGYKIESEHFPEPSPNAKDSSLFLELRLLCSPRQFTVIKSQQCASFTEADRSRQVFCAGWKTRAQKQVSRKAASGCPVTALVCSWRSGSHRGPKHQNSTTVFRTKQFSAKKGQRGFEEANWSSGCQCQTSSCSVCAAWSSLYSRVGCGILRLNLPTAVQFVLPTQLVVHNIWGGGWFAWIMVTAQIYNPRLEQSDQSVPASLEEIMTTKTLVL